MSLIRFNEVVLPGKSTPFSLTVDEGEKVGIHGPDEGMLGKLVDRLLEAEDQAIEHDLEEDECHIHSDGRVEQNLEVKEYFRHQTKQLFHYLDHYERLNIKLTKMMSPVQMPSMLEQIEEMERKLNAWEAWDLDEQINAWIDWLSLQPGEAMEQLAFRDQKRVEICAAIIRPARLLMLDRPFRWFNEAESQQLIDHLNKWAQTLIITSWHEPLLMQVVDRKVGLPENK